MLLTEECKCINWNVAANVSLGCITHQHCLDRYDFNLCLKTGRLREGSLKSSGKLFQMEGPEVVKLRGPIVFVFVLGTRRSPRSVERRRERAVTVDFRTSISVRYEGAIPWRHLWTRRPSLKSILQHPSPGVDDSFVITKSLFSHMVDLQNLGYLSHYFKWVLEKLAS